MNGIWTIPNLLTVSRIMLTPAFAAFYVDHHYPVALGIFVYAVISDALDGTLARLLKQRSKLGAMLDPLADKMLLVTSFICLAVREWVPGWLAVIVVSRDVIIVGGLAVLTFWGLDFRQRIRPTMLSKVNTSLQMLLIFYALCDKAFDLGFSFLGEILIELVAASTVASGAQYVIMGLGMLSGGQSGTPGKEA